MTGAAVPEIGRELFFDIVAEHIGDHLHPRVAQANHPTAIYALVGIPGAYDDPGDACGDYGIYTRWGPPLVRTRLQAHHHCGLGGSTPRCLQRHYFGVTATGRLGGPGGQESSLGGKYHRTNPGIGGSLTPNSCPESKADAHRFNVGHDLAQRGVIVGVGGAVGHGALLKNVVTSFATRPSGSPWWVSVSGTSSCSAIALACSLLM